jgi:hypothetical protein
VIGKQTGKLKWESKAAVVVVVANYGEKEWEE